MAFHFGSFDALELLECRNQLKQVATDATSMEGAAQQVAEYLFDKFRSPNGDHSCVLVRCYLTRPYSDLPEELKAFAEKASSQEVLPRTRCLVLLGTVGVEPEWCDRRQSAGHQAIPLLSTAAVEQLPMVAQLMAQLGVDVTDILDPDPEVIVDMGKRSYNVFHIEDAVGSPYIPAQEEFVVPYGVRSVLGFGGVLAGGDLFSVIMFSREYVSEVVARVFRALSLSVELRLMPHQHRIFERV